METGPDLLCIGLVAGVQDHHAPFGLQTRRSSRSGRCAFALHRARACSISARDRASPEQFPTFGVLTDFAIYLPGISLTFG
jgi:hypothetical protein